MNVTLKHFFYWAVSGLALIALADPFPDLATLLVVILIVGVLLTHVTEFTGFLNNSTPPSVQQFIPKGP
jgi:uncharacterized protein YhhL (DUF1145 family)